MPLTARTSGGEIISALDFSSAHEIRVKFKFGELFCKCHDCGTVMFPRQAEGRRVHFVHTSNCKSEIKSHPESPEHELGKRVLYKHFQKTIKTAKGVRIDLEVPIGNRQADVAVIYDSGYFVVGEVQLAPITTRELMERTDDYEKQGAEVIWWLGGSANTEANREWLKSRFGRWNTIRFHYTTDIEAAEFELCGNELVSGNSSDTNGSAVPA